MSRLAVPIVIIAAALSAAICHAAETTSPDAFEWQELPALPDRLGVGGAFAGVSRGALIVAGGSNFPDKKPWEGGVKHYDDAIHVLEKPDGKWQDGFRLPRPLGYGVSITTDRGLLCIGGEDVEHAFADVFLLEWSEGEIRTTEFPPLPTATTKACGVILGNHIYVAGGAASPTATEATRNFWRLDLAAAKPQWESLDPWDGDPRIFAVAAAQDGAFFVISGARLLADADGKPTRKFLLDAHCYHPRTGWKRIADIPQAAVAAPTAAATLGPTHVLVFGGDDGSQFFNPPKVHRGFPADVLAYHTVTNTWTKFGTLPAAHVTTPLVAWRGGFVVPSGEIHPGVRSPSVWMATPAAPKTRFGMANYLTLAMYPAIMLAISWLVGSKTSSDEFFRGGQRIPWWAAGLSVYATMLSSITFMAIPAKSYATDWSFALANVGVLLLAPLIIRYYVPFFRSLDVTSAYEYLEKRFNLAIRWFGSASFIALQIGRTAIVLYLPALALATVSNFDMRACIVIMGVACILMTFEGGLESVVWTDVAQTVILLAGALVVFAVAIMGTPGGMAEAFRTAEYDHKFFSNLRWDGDLTVATGWVIILGNLFASLASYTAGQDIVQRYLSTKDTASAARSIWTNALMVVPSTIIFFAVGTALYVFYKHSPAHLDPAIKTDAILPLFIVNELPAGMSGIVVAAIFAAAQPTSSLNSIATAWVVDFQARLQPSLSDKARVRIAKAVTVGSGVLGTLLALAMTTFDIASTWDAFLTLIGLTGGALAGLFALGLFTRRANSFGAIVGTICSISLLIYVQRYTSLHFFTYAPIGTVCVFVIGYLASWLVPPSDRDLTGLKVR